MFPPSAFREQASDSAILSRSSDGLFRCVWRPPVNVSVIATSISKEKSANPYVKLRAPAGTIVEMLFLESQEPGNCFFAPIRLWPVDSGHRTRRETTYETFDWDVLRYLS